MEHGRGSWCHYTCYWSKADRRYNDMVYVRRQVGGELYVPVVALCYDDIDDSNMNIQVMN